MKMTEEKHYWNFRLRLFLAEIRLDCEKSLFFFRFSERNARAREREAARRAKRGRHARGHLRVTRFARRTTEEREIARSLR